MKYTYLRPWEVVVVTVALALSLSSTALAISGDVDADGDVDRDDIDAILAALGSPADGPGDPRDLDGDGVITVLDARRAILLCTRPRCATETADEELGIDILEPATDLVTMDDAVTVSGTASGPVHSVTVNGVEATVIHGEFVAETVSLVEGTNQIVATALSAEGDSASDTISVRRDTDPPLIVIETPGDGDRLITEVVTIAGTVNDIIPGATVNEDDVTVTVNGLPAPVDNRTFILPDLPLAEGANTIEAVAVDVAGNVGSTTIEVTREPDLAGIRIVITGGNNQVGSIHSLLPEPLAVQLQTTDGVPISGRPIEFDVSRGDGLLEDPNDDLRVVTLLTDADGNASVDFTLGSRTGEGFHRVRVTTPGSLTFAELCATAQPTAPVNLSITMPPPTQGVVSQALANPLSVIVTDAGGNSASGVAVTFQVEAGGGSFGGEQSVEIMTDMDGIAETFWTLGPDGGVANNEASADFDGNPGLPATFIVSGIATGPIEATTVSGVVQDSAGRPIAGARAVIRGTDLEDLTGPDGAFTIVGVQPGGHRVGVLGSAANDPAAGIAFPDIDYAIEVVSGAANQLDQIVVLPFLDMAGARLVGGDEDVVLAMDGVSGFGVKVFAHSTYIDGVQQEVLMSSSQVKLDKVPMAPPQGSTPLVVGTLQPGGVHFDPPAQVIYPNVEGLPPGDVADIFAFHHDIGEFVNVGPGTVSEDGSVVVSDPGFGIVESGWHCLIRLPGQPAACANNCSVRFDWHLVKNDGSSGPSKTTAPVVLVNTDDDAKKAKITAEFSPGGGTFDSQSWSGGSPIVTLTQESASGTIAMVTLEATTTTGSELVTSPTYQIDDKTCEVDVEVTVNAADLRIIRDNGNANLDDDPELDVLNVSNFLTTDNLAAGDGHEDVDNFKIEIILPGIVGNTIPAAEVQLEALQPDETQFSPRRTLQTALTRVGTSDHFRSTYLRLVVDGIDRAAMPNQTLLVDWDSTDDTVEILGQVVKVTYTPGGGNPSERQATVGSSPRTFRVAAHWLTGSPNVNNASVRQRILREMRRVYAQTSMRPVIRSIQEIDAIQNFVSVSHNTGNPAAGDGDIDLTIVSDRGGSMATWNINHSPGAGRTPRQTADDLEALIESTDPTGGAAGDHLTVETFENNAIFGAGANRRSADLLIRDPMGGEVTVTMAVSADTDQAVAAPPVNAAMIVGDGSNFLIGSIEQRSVVRNFDTGVDTFDIFVSNSITREDGTAIRGRANVTGSARPVHERGTDPFRNNTFVVAAGMDNTGNNPFTSPHEIGHCLLDAGHVTGDATQLMRSGTSAANVVGGSKRIADANRTFNSLNVDAGGDINQVPVMRASPLTSN